MNDPLRILVEDCLDTMHHAFLDGGANALPEFYHQFRKRWDRGIPVGMGLGHLFVKRLGEHALGIHRLGENGTADEALTLVAFDDTPPGDYPHTFRIDPSSRKLLP